MYSNLPAGTVTFLFTDIEGSTQLWEQHPTAMQTALVRHDAILRAAIETNHGLVIKTTGDGLLAVFASAMDGVMAAVSAQGALQAEDWSATCPIRARMALHTGEAEMRDGDYFGAVLNRTARLMTVGAGGQSLVSQSTAVVVQDRLPNHISLRDLGEHRLKDLVRLEHIYQVVAPELRSEFPLLKSLSAFPNNLPVQLTSFVGRGKEIAECQRLLASTRLLTLTGPGGTGKTRLSLQVAAESLLGYQDGVWLVELAQLSDPAYIMPALAAAFDLREQPGRPLAVVVTDYLRGKSLLLLLDNCEHLTEACARLADELLHAAPHLKIIASSREALGLAGETTYRVPSLSLPDAQFITPELLGQCEAARLFIQRAQAAQPRFMVTISNAPAIAAICKRLDGIPLALELAAARVKVLSAEQIAARLDDRFQLLIGGSRAALPRQQTLRALIDWSYDLLPEEERLLLRQLSVFAGGWTLEAAEAVGDCVNVLDTLTQLVNKSLVNADEQGAEMRYRCLETIRQYARDKLFESGEASATRNRHFAYFNAFIDGARARLDASDFSFWRARYHAEVDNLRVAYEWGLVHHPEEVLHMVANMSAANRFALNVNVSEAIQWVHSALERVQALPSVDGEAAVHRQRLHGYGLCALGELLTLQGDNPAAKTTLEEAIVIARAIGDQHLLGYGLGFWLLAVNFTGAPNAWDMAQEALTVSRSIGAMTGVVMTLMMLSRIEDPRNTDAQRSAYVEESLRLNREMRSPLLTAMTSFMLAVNATRSGQFDTARQYILENHKFFVELGDGHFEVIMASELAHIARHTGDFREAITSYKQTLLRWKALGNRAAIANQLECLAFIARTQGYLVRAARLLGAAEALREQAGTPMAFYERAEYAHEVEALQAQMDATAFSQEWTRGSALPMDDAIEYALSEPASDLMARK